MNFDAFIDGLPDLTQGVDPELQQAIAAAQKNPRLQQGIKPTYYNNRETRSPLDILQAEAASQTKPKTNGLDAAVDAMPALKGSQAEQVSPLQAFGIAGGRTLDRLAAGLRQGVQSIPGVGPSIAGALDSIDKLTGAQTPSTDPAVQAANTQAYAPVAKQQPLAAFAGETLPYLAAASPLAMAGMGALEYGTPAERATAGAGGFIGGKIGQGIGRMLGPETMHAAPSEVGDFVQAAGNKWGIPTSVAQQPGAGKTAQIAESVLSNLPFGGAVNEARNASYQGWNRAVANTFGQDTAQITPELLGQAKGATGQAIGKIADRTTVVADPQFAKDFAAASARINNELVGDDAQLAAKWLDNVQAKIGADGTMTGQQYKALRGKIGEAAAAKGGTVASVLGDVRSALTGVMDRSVSPEDSALWQQLNRHYFNVKQVADAAKSTPGSLSPSQLLTQVNAAQKNARFGAGNDLAELAQWGKTTLPDKIPNSGTAQRAYIQQLLTNPLAAGGLLGGAGWSANQLGLPIPAEAGAAALIPFLAARGLAGKPASDLTRRLLMQGGGLLGIGATGGQ